MDLKYYYVSVDGDDENDGSYFRPFRTVYRATLQAKYALSCDPGQQITLLFHKGTYYFHEPLQWTEQDCPNEDGRVSYRAFGNEEAVFSGAVKLEHLDWSRYSGNIMVSPVGTDYDFDVLFVNSQRQIMARYPNLTTPDTLFGFRGSASDALSPERIKTKWKSAPSDGYVRALHDKKWGGNSFHIADVDREGTVTLKWVGDNNRGSGFNASQMVAENIPEELDAPHEWYYDKKLGNLYYYPPKNLDLSAAVLEGAAARELVRLIGSSPASPVKNITFDGIHFTKTHRTLFCSTYERPLRGDWGFARTGAVFLENAFSISVRNCRFTETGGNAVMMSGYNEAHLIDRCEMKQIGASAVLIAGKEAAVHDPSHWDGDDHKTVIKDLTAGPKSEDYPRNITVSNNEIFDLGLYEIQTSGVCMSISSRIHVQGNTIHRCPRAGVNINDGTFGGHLIEDNDIFDCVRGTSDHGPINAWGRDRFWSLGGYDTSGKKGQEKAPYAYLDAVEPTVIRHNRISHDYGDYGVDLDDGSGNYRIYDNLFLGTGIKLREGFDRIVKNNIIINSSVNIHVSYQNNNDRIENNVIISSCPYKFISPNEGSKTVFAGNLLYDGGRDIDVHTDGLSADRDYISADPKFRDPSLNDYTFASDSPALRTGIHNISMNGFGVPGAPTPHPQVLDSKAEERSDEEEFLGGRICSVYSEDIISAAGLGDSKGVYLVKPPSFPYTGTEILYPNDVIRELNGIEMENKEGFLDYYRRIPVGTEVSAAVYRNQSLLMTQVKWSKQ